MRVSRRARAARRRRATRFRRPQLRWLPLRRQPGDRRHRRRARRRGARPRRSSSARAASCARAGLADFTATHIEVLGAEALYGPHARTRGVARGDDARGRRPSAEGARSRCSRARSRRRAPRGRRAPPGPGGGRPAVSPLIKPFSFLLDKAAVPVAFVLDGQRHRGATVARGCRRRHRARCADAAAPWIDPDEPTDERAADPPRLGAQRRQGQPLEHRRRSRAAPSGCRCSGRA